MSHTILPHISSENDSVDFLSVNLELGDTRALIKYLCSIPSSDLQNAPTIYDCHIYKQLRRKETDLLRILGKLMEWIDEVSPEVRGLLEKPGTLEVLDEGVPVIVSPNMVWSSSQDDIVDRRITLVSNVPYKSVVIEVLFDFDNVHIFVGDNGKLVYRVTRDHVISFGMLCGTTNYIVSMGTLDFICRTPSDVSNLYKSIRV